MLCRLKFRAAEAESTRKEDSGVLSEGMLPPAIEIRLRSRL